MKDSTVPKHEPEGSCSSALKPKSTHEQKILNALFIETVKTNYGLYLRKCYTYVKCPSMAEDAVQEGILAAHLNLSSVKNNHAIAAWLYRIVIRKAIDLFYKKKKFIQFNEELEELVSYDKFGFLEAPISLEASNPVEDIIMDEGVAQITAALAVLDDSYRIPILLKDFEGFSTREISEVLQISESNTKVRIHRARLKLKIQLNEYFFPDYMSDFK